MAKFLTRDDAREIFENYGLNYRMIHRWDLHLLMAYLGQEFEQERKTDTVIYPKLRNKIVFKRTCGTLQYAYLYVDGSYFKKREAVSFNEGGFIGFAGWASDRNVQPILRAFVRWCSDMAERCQ